MKINDNSKKTLKLALGIVISIAGLFWVFYDFDFRNLSNIMNNTNPYLIAISVIILIITIIIRSYIWKYLLIKRKPISTYSLYKAELIGYFGNNVLPFKFGELVRTYYIGKKHDISKSFVLTTVVFERLLDIFCLVIFSIIIVSIYDLPDQINNWIYNFFWIFLICLFCSIFIINSIKKVNRYKDFLKSNKYLAKLNKISTLLSIQYILTPLFLSMLLWLFYLGYTHSVQGALGLNMSIIQTLLLLVLSALVQIVPSAPGTVGTYHAAIKFTMVNIFGFENEVGVVMAILLHSISYILFTVLGAMYYMKAHLEVSEVLGK